MTPIENQKILTTSSLNSHIFISFVFYTDFYRTSNMSDDDEQDQPTYAPALNNLQRQPAKSILKKNPTATPQAPYTQSGYGLALPTPIPAQTTPTQAMKSHEEHVVWDEENLHKNESERVPTMKIDEPPTPYHKGMSPQDGPMGADDNDLDDFSLNPLGKDVELTTVLQNTQFNTMHADNLAMEDSSSEESEDEFYGMTEEEKREKIEKHNKFEQMRKQHYVGVGGLMMRQHNPLARANNNQIDSSDEESDYDDKE